MEYTSIHAQNVCSYYQTISPVPSSVFFQNAVFAACGSTMSEAVPCETLVQAVDMGVCGIPVWRSVLDGDAQNDL